MEETHDACDGVEFLSSTRHDWEKSALGNHIAWHLALHYFGITARAYDVLVVYCEGEGLGMAYSTRPLLCAYA